MLGGLAGLIHLNGDFSIQNPTARGTTTPSSILPQKKVLMAFMHSLDFIRMKQFTGFTVSGSEIQARGIAEPGKQYALYLFHGNRKWEDWPQNRCAVRFNVSVGRFKDTVKINIPSGKYKIDWVNPSSGVLIDSTTYQDWRGGNLILQTPVYQTDLALRMKSLKPIR
jgi:hypothetical protein